MPAWIWIALGGAGVLLALGTAEAVRACLREHVKRENGPEQ